MVSLALGEDLGANGIGACVDALLTLNKVKPTFHIFDPREPFERHAEQEVTACLPDNLVVLLRLESGSGWIVVHLKRSVAQVDVCDTAEPATELDVIKAWIEPWIKARLLVDLGQLITYTSLVCLPSSQHVAAPLIQVNTDPWIAAPYRTTNQDQQRYPCSCPCNFHLHGAERSDPI